PVFIRLHVLVDGKPYLAAWREFLEYAYKQADIDGNGELSPQEAARIPPASTLFGSPFLAKDISILDEVKSTTAVMLGPTDLDNYFRRSGFSAFRVEVNSAFPQAMVKTGAGILRRPGAPTADAYNEALFSLLDTNKDGKLSKEELEAAPAILLQHAENDEEVLKAQELLGSAPNSSDQVPVRTDHRAFA